MVTWWFRARETTALFSKASVPHGRVEPASGASQRAVMSEPPSDPPEPEELEEEEDEEEEDDVCEEVDVAAEGELHADVLTARPRRARRTGRVRMARRQSSLVPREFSEKTRTCNGAPRDS
jgi:hypothetical protein